jgi:3-methyladenine DNA glycosylase/8-oxoguanine DNA glycosylase
LAAADLTTIIKRQDKAKAVCATAARMEESPATYTQRAIDSMSEAGALAFFRSHPFIGPVTQYHLARNLGFNVVKPDVHLVRLAKKFSFEDADALCSAISREVGLRKGLVDLVLWRYCASGPTGSRPTKPTPQQRLPGVVG